MTKSKFDIFLDWLVKSSAHPEKLAMSVKGFCIGILPMAVITLRLFGIELTGGENIINDIENIIVVGLGIVAGGTTLYGLIRKIIGTMKGNFDTVLGCWK